MKKQTTIKDEDAQISVVKEMLGEGKDGDTYSYKGWLVSDKMWKRIAALIGYNLIAYGSVVVISLLLIASFSFIGSLI